MRLKNKRFRNNAQTTIDRSKHISPHIAREREILAQGRCVTVRDKTEKQGHSLVEGASRAVARMNQREIAQAQFVP
jgi:dethiobiotin synthetase